jgi:hypothetical protein
MNALVQIGYFRFFLLSFSLNLPRIVGWVADDNENRRVYLFPDALGIFFNKHAICLPTANQRYLQNRFPEMACIHLCFIIGMLDIHRGDVIWQKHHFVAMQFIGILMRSLNVNFTHDG